MPSSKRNKTVPLTVTRKKGREHKAEIIKRVRDAALTFSSCYLIEIENESSSALGALRADLKPSKIIKGKNRVVQVALGTTSADECADGIHKIAKMLTGKRALIFSDFSLTEIEAILSQHKEESFAKSNFTATETIILKSSEQPLREFPFSLEPEFRSLGLPTRLENGEIKLLGDFEVCQKGKPLTPERARILKHLGIKMCRFDVSVVESWTNPSS